MRLVALLAALVASFACAAAWGQANQRAAAAGKAQRLGPYIVLAWNDLGMHCISPRFAEMAILPPYNNLQAIVIRRGDDPSIVTSGLTITYSLDNNTQVGNKTDFWQYAPKLFGLQLQPGVGLAGNGFSGTMAVSSDHFEAVGVPALPYLDSGKWQPFQHATIKVAGQGINLSTDIVVPVSDEMNCAKCHGNGQVAAKGISTPTVEGNILTLHDRREKTTLMASRPVLCASCHSDNALGTKGNAGVLSLSRAMHTKHSTVKPQPVCYDCHPGAKTQCNRSAGKGMGPVKGDPQCNHCHGNLNMMATALAKGRQPWLQEPTCAHCHGAAFSTGATLFRKARGHGGVLCIACHNSPHAWYPSTHKDDNAQPLALQGNSKAIGFMGCSVCHTDGRISKMPPHGDGFDGGGK